MSSWPSDPDGDMAPVLEQSIEAAKRRHPSGVEIIAVTNIVLTALDRCDTDCSAAAVYRVTSGATATELDFCGHHWRKHFPAMALKGWTVTGTNPELM